MHTAYRQPVPLLLVALVVLVLVKSSVWAASLREHGIESNQLHSGLEVEMLVLVNQARAVARTCGDKKMPAAEPLQWSDRLAAAALYHAEDMARKNYFSHTSHNGTTLADRVRRSGYAYLSIGENIAAEAELPSVVEHWLKSPGHCANMMNKDFTEMGAASALSSTKTWETRWVQVLGKRK
jgi:uncharacterized protein YkwD